MVISISVVASIFSAMLICFFFLPSFAIYTNLHESIIYLRISVFEGESPFRLLRPNFSRSPSMVLFSFYVRPSSHVICLFFPLHRSISFLSGHTLGVSNAGVIPARVLPPIPKTCRAPFNPPTPSNNARTVHFGLLESKLESYIGFNLTNERSAIFKER